MNKSFFNQLFTFIFGGAIVLTVSIVSEMVSNTYAALLWAFPFTIIPTIYYLYIENKSNKHILDFIKKTNISIIILFFVIFALYLFYFYSKNLLTSIFFSIILYIIICGLFIYIVPF
jgi:hypothetical protein